MAIVGFGMSILSGQSMPGWWKYVPSDSTAIVGIRWQTAQSTLFAPAILDDLEQFQDWDLLPDTDRILIASPSMLTIASGTFSQARLRQATTTKGFRRETFASVELWIAPDGGRPSIAIVSDKLLLIGPLSEIQVALNTKYRSPMLAHAARYSEEDLWVVASRLPDTLASRFIPMEIEATAFEGSVSAWDGLHLVAAIEQTTSARAEEFADELELALDAHPAMAVGTEIMTHARSALVRMDLDKRQLAAALRLVVVAAAIATPVEPTPASPRPTVKILGLSTGTREIQLGR